MLVWFWKIFVVDGVMVVDLVELELLELDELLDELLEPLFDAIFFHVAVIVTQLSGTLLSFGTQFHHSKIYPFLIGLAGNLIVSPIACSNETSVLSQSLKVTVDASFRSAVSVIEHSWIRLITSC